jgi:HSP20 family protein
MFSLMPWRTARKGPTSPAPRAEYPLGFFRGEVEEWFERLFKGWPALLEAGWANGMEMEEKEEAVLVRVDAPGFEPGEFEVGVTGETLTIAAEHKAEAKGEEPMVQRRMQRVVTLPVPVEAEKVEAKYRHGVLELSLPKAEPTKARKIEVKAE